MFQSLLIANRGEIACRIARTARRMGIETIAVFSEADALAMHLEAADRAIRIGAAPARESYLNIPRIIEAARRTGAQAIHPGYGFLSENPAFAEACAQAGLVWVGPPPEAMRAMGSKAAAKRLMERSGVPVLPGYHGAEQDPARLGEEAARVGFPLVIKAVAGGGGRGMRVVRSASEFETALASARQEAASAFGDEAVLIERYLERPRHIEVQIFADTHGNAVHLFERDCSTQRRHQKIIEEAPAPGLDAITRAAMGEAAIAAARAVGYTGAGTVEFVAEDDGFYFLEMNTRLQVEHPVTEMITGFDLVEWQLRIAAGEELPAAQHEIRVNGHAFEARLYAEDPARDFAPSIGRIAVLQLPREGDGIRVDAGFRSGDSISVHYDAMIGKLICHAATRAEALGKLRLALADCDVAGVASNLDLLGRIASHPAFAAGGIDTGFIARHAGELLSPRPTPPLELQAIAALGVLDIEARNAPSAADPWDARDGWWLNATPERLLDLCMDDTPCPVRLAREGPGWRIAADGQSLLGRIAGTDSAWLWIELDGLRHRAAVHVAGETVTVRWCGETWQFLLPDPALAAEQEDEAGGRLVAPIPGQVTAVHVQAGQKVHKGAVLVVLEAMKTVFRLTAPADAEVIEVTCRPGDAVEDGQVLVRFADGKPD